MKCGFETCQIAMFYGFCITIPIELPTYPQFTADGCLLGPMFGAPAARLAAMQCWTDNLVGIINSKMPNENGRNVRVQQMSSCSKPDNETLVTLTRGSIWFGRLLQSQRMLRAMQAVYFAGVRMFPVT